MTSKTNNELEILTKALGDLSKWRRTGLCLRSKVRGDERVRVWLETWKNSPFKLNQFENLPNTRDPCHCSTPIINNHLIIHIETRPLEFVGSTCIGYFPNNFKPCKECFRENTCKTTRCRECRRYCQHHNLYHDDNSVHEPKLSLP